MELNVRNVNVAVGEALWYLRAGGDVRATRNGVALVAPDPVTTLYRRPTERVLFWPARDANPYFHLMESLWMLAGRRDVAFLKQFNSGIDKFSDDGVTFNAAYGHRWRRHFGFDQIIELVRLLKREPDTRRAVLQIWEPNDLCNTSSKDLACNTQVYFEGVDGALNMVVLNRSNDLIWGCYGANAVQFSMLHEFMAGAVGMRVGMYRQFSRNLHLYRDLYGAGKSDAWLDYPPSAEEFDHYATGAVEPYPLFTGSVDGLSWLSDVEEFCERPDRSITLAPFFSQVAQPMYRSWAERKAGGTGLRELQWVKATDWQRAAHEWIMRRSHAE